MAGTQKPGAQVSQGEGAQYEAFLEHFLRDRERVFAYIFSLVPHNADAEDLFQKCSLVLWRKFADFRPDQSFLAWACGVAHYEVRNFLRTAGRERLFFDDELVRQLASQRLESLAAFDERRAALRECLQGLNDGQRALIDAAYGNGGTVKQLAETTGGALQTLYNRLGRIRRQLLQCVQSKLAAQV